MNNILIMTKPIPSHSSRPALWRLLLTQTQVIFADNAGKLGLIALIQFPGIVAGGGQVMLISLLAGLLVGPFILFSPLAGWVSDRFPKRRVLEATLLAQLMAFGCILVALLAQRVEWAIGGFALLALQSVFFSPARQGILKEVVGEARIGSAAGLMALTGIAAIFGGTFFGGWFFDQASGWAGDPWQGAVTTFLALSVSAAVAWLCFRRIKTADTHTCLPFRARIFYNHFRYVGLLWRYPTLRFPAFGNVFFFGLGGILYLLLVQIGRELHGGALGSATESGGFLLLLGGGIAAGNLFAAWVCRRGLQTGLIVPGALAVALGLAGLALMTPGSGGFTLALLLTGVGAGLFIVPVEALLQVKPKDYERGRVLAAGNLFAHGAGLIAVALYYGLTDGLGLSPSAQIGWLILPAVVMVFFALRYYGAESLRLLLSWPFARLLRLRVAGREHLPARGGALFIANHVSYADAVAIQSAMPRQVRFLGANKLRRHAWLRQVFSLFGVLPVSPENPREAIRAAVKSLQAGEWVCIFPEGHISTSGTLEPLQKGFELMARKAGVPVVPIHVDGLWGTLFGTGPGRARRRFSLGANRVRLQIGKPLVGDEVTVEKARQSMMDLGEVNFSQRAGLKKSLGWTIVTALRGRWWRVALIDRHPARKSIRSGLLLGAASALAWNLRHVGRDCNRVAIALPPGAGAVVANLAMVISGRTPVNLNFTAGRAALESAVRQAGLTAMITVPQVRAKFPDIPATPSELDMAAEMKALGRIQIVGWAVAAVILPASLLLRILGGQENGGDQEAALLFTSGSSGDPKGVPLTHENLLANLFQTSGVALLRDDDRLLACLPFFHSFGFTVTFWLPLLRGITLVTSPLATDARAIVKTVKEERITLLAGTALFLRLYLERMQPGDFDSLRLVVAGAEKLPRELTERYRSTCGVPVREGYGLTETAPAVAVNVADVGTYGVGPLLPGMTARLVNPESGQDCGPDESGVLWLRGANVFGGYLHEQGKRERENLKEGWLCTGDIARFAWNGELIIEGRLSRFSKMGGEMVPHGTVEDAVRRVLAVSGDAQPGVVVLGVPDEQRGERLVLLAALPVDANDLRQRLIEDGLPRLWIPREIVTVASIPVLASGKLHLAACKAMAEAGLNVAA